MHASWCIVHDACMHGACMHGACMHACMHACMQAIAPRELAIQDRLHNSY